MESPPYGGLFFLGNWDGGFRLILTLSLLG